MDAYYEYLAVQVLNEKQIVTYRTVSRALKVHVNLAKQMLWEFHRRENARSAQSVHATYLLMGRRGEDTLSSTKSSQQQDGEDIVMDSSPPLPGSSMPISELEASQPVFVPQKTMLLVKQEDLDEARRGFSEITSIHVYSLEANGLGDFQLLTECNRKIASTLRTDDILETGKQYGTIQNAGVKRRTRKTALPPATTAKVALPEAKPIAAAPNSRKASEATTKPAAKSSTTSKPPLLKQNSSGIAASFAKGASKPKTAPKPASTTPAAADTDAQETSMGGMSDDDGVGDGEDQDADIEIKAPSGKSKKDRQAELEAMMDAEDEGDDDEIMKDVDETAAAEEEPAAPIDKDPPVEAAKPSEAVVVENGRRRGRRRVMKKKTVRDEEGYLVTKEEAVWESFSEDEPVAKKSTSTAAAPPVAKKAAKQGQGNIMSFFSKK